MILPRENAITRRFGMHHGNIFFTQISGCFISYENCSFTNTRIDIDIHACTHASVSAF